LTYSPKKLSEPKQRNTLQWRFKITRGFAGRRNEGGGKTGSRKQFLALGTLLLQPKEGKRGGGEEWKKLRTARNNSKEIKRRKKGENRTRGINQGKCLRTRSGR